MAVSIKIANFANINGELFLNACVVKPFIASRHLILQFRLGKRRHSTHSTANHARSVWAENIANACICSTSLYKQALTLILLCESKFFL